MTEQEFAQLYGFDADDMAVIKPAMRMFNGTIIRVERRTGAELAKAGMERAAIGAEIDCPGWGDMALNAVREFIKHHSGRFQAEDVRAFAKNLPPAPNLRAWGNVMVKAARKGLIRNTGETEQVKNPLAHNANAAVWQIA